MEEHKPKQGSSLPPNLRLVFCNKEMIKPSFEELGIRFGHVTSGAYIELADEIVPRVLAGFERVIGDEEIYGVPLIVAVHSDASMQSNTGARFERDIDRAIKVARPLAERYPDRQIAVLRFDEKTSADLCLLLGRNGFSIESYHNAEAAPGRNDLRHTRHLAQLTAV